MKQFLPKAIFCLFVLFSLNAAAQSSCPNIVNSTFRLITSNSNPCDRRISFDFVNPTSGAKRIRVEVLNGNTILINECIDASGQSGVQRNFTSSNFNMCNLANLEVRITPYTGSSCGSNSCSATIRSFGGAPLPVTFSSFTLSRNNAAVAVKWETATEINNSGFSIERNINGNWESVTFIRSQANGGNSSSRLSYEYTDINNSKSVSQYRIKQVDIDGQFKYSEIRAIRGTEQDARTMVFPNPSSNGTVNVVFADASVRDIMLVDMAGRTVKQWNAYSNNSLQVNNLVPGMYTLRSFDRETATQQVQKIVINGR